jgi:hypothetical protein
VLDTERADVAEGGQEVGDQDARSRDTNEVVGDESPDDPVSAMGNSSGGQERKDEEC